MPIVGFSACGGGNPLNCDKTTFRHMSTSTSTKSDVHDLFQVRGTTLTAMVLKVIDSSQALFFPQLANKVRQAPGLFQNSPIVIDLEESVTELGVPELSAMAAKLRQINLRPIGVISQKSSEQKAAIAIGLAVIPPGKNAKPIAENETKTETTQKESINKESMTAKRTMLITEPVRSGQQIYAEGCDLIVMAQVSQGSELLADGNIHVYGPMRGRAIAGLNGDASARIFCQSLEAELISIDGCYKISEDIDKKFWKQRVQVYLANDVLCVEKLA